MFGKFGADLKKKAHDAAEEAAGVDLDGDGKIGNKPITQQPAARQTPAAGAPAAAAKPPTAAVASQALQGVLANPALKTQLSGILSGNKVKPGAGGFLSLLGAFNNFTPEVQASAARETAKLDDGSTMPLSDCTGRKRSLLIGINYVGTQAQLKGCVNDVKNIKDFIVSKMHFPTDANSMRILTDDGQGFAMPTKAEIEKGMKWLIEGAKSGDSLFIHYSGHGSTSKDVSPDTDEADGQDETLVPMDYQTAGMIVDDDIFAMMVLPLPKGVRLTAIMDCCHSGSVFDLPYSYVLEVGRDLPTEIDNRKVAIAAAMAAGKAFMAGDKAGAMKSLMEAAKAGAAAYLEQQQHGAAGAGQQQQPQQQQQEYTPAPSEPVFQTPEPAYTAPTPAYSAPTPAYSAPATNPSSANMSDSSNVSANAVHIRTALADVIQFSGCKDEQTSADAFIGGESTGAMSYAFVKAFTDNGMNQSYAELLRNIRTILQGKYKQIPQMSVGHKMVNLNAPFKM